MRHKTHTLAECVFLQTFKIVVWIRLSEAELITVLGPIAIPSIVPSLNKHRLQAMLGSKINITLGIGSCGTMLWPLRPSIVLHVHAPPDADILSRFYPGRILNTTRLIEIKHQFRRYQIARFTGNNDGTPRRHKRSLGIHLHTILPRGKGSHKGNSSPRQMTGSIVETCIISKVGLVKRHKKRVPHLDGYRCVDGVLPAKKIFGPYRFIINGSIGWLRPCLGISRHGYLRFLFHDAEVDEILLLWKLITEAYSIIEGTENNVEQTFFLSALLQFYFQLVIVVAHHPVLTPWLRPRFVFRIASSTHHLEVIAEITIIKCETEIRGVHYGFAISTDCVERLATLDTHGNTQATIGRSEHVSSMSHATVCKPTEEKYSTHNLMKKCSVHYY